MNVKVDTDDYKIKNALDGAKGSLQAVIDFLSKNGVAKASVRELQKGLTTATEYVSIMERAQEYAECVAESRMAAAQSERADHRDKQKSKQLIAMMVCLFISSWESLGRYQAAVYKQAYKNVRRIAESDRQMFSGSGAESERTLSLHHQNNMAEQCCASQKGLILAEEWGNYVSRATTPASPATTATPDTSIDTESTIEIDAAASFDSC
jgi:hypothetical protein